MWATRSGTGLFVAVFVAVNSCISLGAELLLGESIEGSTNGDRPATYSFEADGPGGLAIVVRADDDVVINVLSARGRPVEGGHIDIDFEGDAGAEQGTIILSRTGEYEVRVEPISAEADFVLVAAWLPFAEVARATDPMGSAEQALEMEVNQTYVETIDNTDIDREDWYRLVVSAGGLLTVATKSRTGDLILDYYVEDDLEFPIEHSDRDVGGNLGREVISLDVREGDVYYFVVSAHGNQADYTLCGVITDN